MVECRVEYTARTMMIFLVFVFYSLISRGSCVDDSEWEMKNKGDKRQIFIALVVLSYCNGHGRVDGASPERRRS